MEKRYRYDTSKIDWSLQFQMINRYLLNRRTSLASLSKAKRQRFETGESSHIDFISFEVVRFVNVVCQQCLDQQIFDFNGGQSHAYTVLRTATKWPPVVGLIFVHRWFIKKAIRIEFHWIQIVVWKWRLVNRWFCCFLITSLLTWMCMRYKN